MVSLLTVLYLAKINKDNNYTSLGTNTCYLHKYDKKRPGMAHLKNRI